MSHSLITAVFDSSANAGRALEQLVLSGFERQRMSVLMGDDVRRLVRAKEDDAPIQHPASPETIRATGLGAMVGGTLAALAGVAISMTGIGLVVAGPLAAALGAGAIGTMAGGCLGALVGMDVHDDIASTYVRDLQGGALLVGVDCEPAKTDLAKELLRGAGGRDLAVVERV